MTTLGVLRAAATCETPVQFEIRPLAFAINAATAPRLVLPEAIMGSYLIRPATLLASSISSFVPVMMTS